MTTAGSNFISGITTTVFASTDVVNKTYVDAIIPSQTGNAGKFLTTTDGTNLSWDYVSNYQEFTATGAQTFTVPSQANLLYIEAVGAGGGGNAGQTTAQAAVTWTLRTSGFATNYIYSLTFANNTYVAGGLGGLLNTSTDAITWTLRTSGFGTTQISALTFGNNLYVAGGVSGILNTSTDAIVWTLRTSGTVTNLNDLAYASGQTNTYVASGASGVLTTSTDTITWTLRTSGFGTGTLTALTFANNTYVAGSSSGALNISTDAITWTLRTSGFGTSTIQALTYGNNTYVAAGAIGKLNTSTNAITWILRTSGDITNGIIALVYASGATELYIAAGSGGRLNTSTNAIVWTLRTSNITSSLNALTFGNNTYVTGGSSSGDLATSYSQASGRGGSSGSYTSWYVSKSIVSSNITVNPGVGGTGGTTDAATGSAGAGTTVSWTGPGGTYTVTASGGSGTAAGAAQTVTQSSYFYATAGLTGATQSPLGNGFSPTTQTNQFQPTGGGSGAVYTENWSWILRTSGFGTTNINALTYANNTYLAGGDSAIITASTDSINWTFRTSGTASNLYALTYANNIYLAGGSSGRLNTSTDTITWTARTVFPVLAANQVNAIIFGNNLYVAGTGLGLNTGNLSTSTDTIRWTLRTSGFGDGIYSLTFGNNTYVAGGSSGILNTSTDAIIWELRTAGFGSNRIYSLTFGTTPTNTYVAGSASGRLNTSTDAITWTLRTAGFGANNVSVLTYINNLYYAGVASGTLATSTDAITWTLRTSNTTQQINALTYSSVNNDVVYGGNSSVIGDLYLVNFGGSGGTISVYGLSTSASGGNSSVINGTTAVAISGLPYGYGGGGGGARAESSYWNLRTSGTTSNLNSISGVNFYDDIGGYYNYYGVMSAGDSGVLSTSTDGVNWTLRTSSFGTTTIRASLLTYSSGEKNIIVGDGGKLRTSTNGIEWSTYASGTGNSLYAIGPGQGTDDGTWTIGGASGYLASSGSFNLTTWTSRTSGFGSNAIYAINFADPTGINRSAAGANGSYAYSTDSIVWTSRTTAFGTSAIRGLGNNGFIAVGDSGKIATTTNTIIWTLRTSGTTSQLNSISSGTNPYIVGGSGGITLFSTDGIIWITKLSSTTNNINSVYYGTTFGNNTFYVGNSGTIAILKNPLPVDGGNGGNGVRGGGGGGGASIGSAFGNGGNGGDGYVRITWW